MLSVHTPFPISPLGADTWIGRRGRLYTHRTMNAPQPIQVIRQPVAPQEIALTFLMREMFKLYPAASAAFDEVIAHKIDGLPERLGQEKFWRLIAGLSEGYMLKGIYRLLTNSKFSWQLEEIRMDDVTMTGMGGVLDELLAAADWTPSQFADVWKAQPQSFKDEEGLDPHPRRDHTPIVLYEQDGNLRVMDGMRRTCVAAIQRQDSIQAYVGRITNPGGQSMISPDKVMYTMLLYDEVDHKPPGLLDAIKTILITYKKNYRNGPEVVNELVSPWLEDPEYADVAREISDA